MREPDGTQISLDFPRIFGSHFIPLGRQWGQIRAPVGRGFGGRRVTCPPSHLFGSHRRIPDHRIWPPRQVFQLVDRTPRFSTVWLFP